MNLKFLIGQAKRAPQIRVSFEIVVYIIDVQIGMRVHPLKH